MLSCSYTHIQVQWTFSFWKRIFCYGVANHLYYMQQILHNIFVWQSGLKICFYTDYLFCMTWLENIIQSILLAKLSAPQIFLFDGQAWKHDFTKIVITAIIKCLSKKYFLFRGPAWKCFVVLIISRKCTANIFVSQSGLKTLLHGHNWLQQYLLVVQVSYTWVKNFFFMTGLEKFLQFILSGKPVWRSGLKTRFCGDYRSQQLFT